MIDRSLGGGLLWLVKPRRIIGTKLICDASFHRDNLCCIATTAAINGLYIEGMIDECAPSSDRPAASIAWR